VDRLAHEGREGQPSKLGLDTDLARKDRKLRLPEDIKSIFLDQIEKDSKFLRAQNIMDYSLLLGLHFHNEDVYGDERKETRGSSMWSRGIISSDGKTVYHMGIIDILQLYNFNKKAERLAKSYLLWKDKNGISAVPPLAYSKRFINAIESFVD